MVDTPNVQVRGPMHDRFKEILSEEALAFVARLHESFDARRRSLLEARDQRQAELDEGQGLGLLDETREVREGSWQVAPVPEEIRDRRVEITGPTDRKMMINALNSGSNVFMADLEDANVPSWENMITGQVNLKDAVAGTIRFEKDDGTVYELDDEIATLFVRPRGLHLDQPEVLVDGVPVAGAFLDFGLYIFHNGATLAETGKGPFFYLPKLESHKEARLWNDVFVQAQEELGIEQGTIKATVLLETLPAAFEMEEILYELRDHSAGLNAGRWDYIFSCIKTHRNQDGLVFPDRGEITMTVPFMRAYTERIVRCCHKRGAFAMGGMAALIPSKDPEANERAFAAVRQDKEREATDGFDGTWIAHPGLVDVAREPFDAVLDGAPNQISKAREDVDEDALADELTDFTIEGGTITEAGLRTNVNVGLRYIASWLTGWGAAAIDNLMEDTATAEISRAQVWQWVQNGATLEDGRTVTRELVQTTMEEELDKVRGEMGEEAFQAYPFQEAAKLFEQVALADDFPDFLTIPGQERID